MNSRDGDPERTDAGYPAHLVRVEGDSLIEHNASRRVRTSRESPTEGNPNPEERVVLARGTP